MRERSIDRIRNATFSHAVRGYDRHEVDRFLGELADWLEEGGEGETTSETIRAELERVGEQTGAILTEAHDAAEAIRDNAAAEARQKLVTANVTAESIRTSAGEQTAEIREEADAYALRTRTEADEHAEAARAEADSYASEQRSDAEAAAEAAREDAKRAAERIVAEANRRRTEIEETISDLERRRDAVLAELDRLASGITGAASRHRAEGEPGPDAEAAPEREDAEVDSEARTARHPSTSA